MQLLAYQLKAGCLVDAASRDQYIVGPQLDFAVTGQAREGDAFVDEMAPDPEPARVRLDIEQAQFGDFLGVLNKHHRPDDVPLTFGDPAALPMNVVILDEGRGHACDQGLEGHVEAVFLGVERAVPMDDPADVAGTVRTENI